MEVLTQLPSKRRQRVILDGVTRTALKEVQELMADLKVCVLMCQHCTLAVQNIRLAECAEDLAD